MRSVGLGLLAPRVTPPWREGASPLIASSYCRTSCPGGEAGLAWVALTPGLRLETVHTVLGPQSQVGLGEQSLRVPAPRVQGPVLGSSFPFVSASLRALRLPGGPLAGRWPH